MPEQESRASRYISVCLFPWLVKSAMRGIVSERDSRQSGGCVRQWHLSPQLTVKTCCSTPLALASLASCHSWADGRRGRVYPAPEQGLRLRTGEEGMGWRKKTRCVLQNNVPSRTNTRDENIHLNLQHHNRWREFTNLELFVNTPGGQLLFHGRYFFLQFCWSNKIDSDESVVVVK